jgi:hypothetical protein
MNTIQIEVQVSDEDINDIMVAALEGGINYWCNEASCQEQDGYLSDMLSKGKEIILEDDVSGDTVILNKEKLLKGIKLAIKQGYISLTGDYRIDTGQIDACDADTIVQLALFDTVIYG